MTWTENEVVKSENLFQRLYVEDIINDRKKNEQDIFQNLDNYDLTTKFDLQRKSI